MTWSRFGTDICIQSVISDNTYQQTSQPDKSSCRTPYGTVVYNAANVRTHTVDYSNRDNKQQLNWYYFNLRLLLLYPARLTINFGFVLDSPFITLFRLHYGLPTLEMGADKTHSFR